MFLNKKDAKIGRRKAILIWSILLAFMGVACQVQKVEPSQSEANDPIYKETPLLLSAKQLKEEMGSHSNQVVVEVSPEKTYKKGHIPGAIHLWRSDYGSDAYEYGGMMASRENIAKMLGEHGITPQTELVLYDGRDNCNAARLWWILDQYGHRNVKMLNGGKQGWAAAGYDLSKTAATLPATQYAFASPARNDLTIDMAGVKAAMDDPNSVIVDTRSYDEYKGKVIKKGAYRAGHIPGAIRLDYVDAVTGDNSGGYRLKSKEELQKMFADQGVTPDKQVITYCHSGVRSAFTTFVLKEVLDYPNVKNYDGSWTEWSYNKDLPTEKIGIGEIIAGAYSGYAGYFLNSILFKVSPWYKNYFWYLILISAIFFLLEIVKPWRKDQPKFRKDFWLDFFYMFFNFFLFSLIIYNAASDVFVNLFNNLLWTVGIKNLVAIEIQSWPIWAQLIILFVVADFIQWNTHRLLHRVPFLWEFHKVHHSVEQMGFAAHLRFHWMETLVYKSIQYVPLAMIGFGIDDFFLVYIFNIMIGHYNHANIQAPKWLKGMLFGALLGALASAIIAESSLELPAGSEWAIYLGIVAALATVGTFTLGGIVNYIFNSPEMHIWHHAWDMPEHLPYGINFGLTLSVWDYLFKTNWIPHDGRDIKLGFPGLEEFPQNFMGQAFFGLVPQKKKKKED